MITITEAAHTHILPAQPADIPPCPGWDAEPRGPGLLLAGLCIACGRSTLFRDDSSGHPRHLDGRQ